MIRVKQCNLNSIIQLIITIITAARDTFFCLLNLYSIIFQREHHSQKIILNAPNVLLSLGRVGLRSQKVLRADSKPIHFYSPADRQIRMCQTAMIIQSSILKCGRYFPNEQVKKPSHVRYTVCPGNSDPKLNQTILSN